MLLLRPSRRLYPSNLPRIPFSRHTRLALLFLLTAAILEVILHVRSWTVQQPSDHELDTPFYTSCQEPATTSHQPREKAALVMLVRNSELLKALKTVQSIEKHFNQWFHYPVVFLNDEPFSQEFVSVMNASVSGEARFEHLVSRKEWGYPEWMDVSDVKDAKEAIKQQGEDGILYAGMETYHHMCRFYSGKFYTLPALRDYKWYWRIEPDVDFYCSITYDPFVEMAKHDKVYGFTIALSEEPRTCPSLFRKVADYKEQHNIPTTELWKATVSPSWVPWPLRSFVMPWFFPSHCDRSGDGWSLCHYWSNFEIANLDFFRGREYQRLFEYLDKTGGFYYERWGDAAIHSLAVQMLLPSHKVHHFEDFGYRHDWFYQCPANTPNGQLLESESLPVGSYYPEREGGIGCRCECDGSRTRNYPAYCTNKLKQPNTARRIGTLELIRSWFP
ncbi:nucleotide-diphospho-sugar transferase [Sordaria brevicollis]|uniref:Nucleotide-diphospho-sugar transferase n=1 Tax=Sordaria brevicollis TaxID=83679 RepID=A0AAE0UF95_SORBR|nr:nucleotide-diphospho-sugar transferase [Sordaria brevicollis]